MAFTYPTAAIPVRSASGHDAMHRAMHARLNAACYAGDYGVTADGVTDDSAALQACVDNAGARFVLLPTGTLALASPVTVPVTVSGIVGQGARATVLAPTTMALNLSTDTASASSLHLADFGITGGTVGLQVGGTNAVEDATLERILLVGQSDTGIALTGEFVSVEFQHVTVKGTADVHPAYGVHLQGTIQRTLTRFLACTFQRTATAGIYLDCPMRTSADVLVSIDGCRFEGNLQHSIRTGRTWSTAIRNSYFEDEGNSAGGPYAAIHVEAHTAPVDMHSRRLLVDSVFFTGVLANAHEGQPPLFLHAEDDALTDVTLLNCNWHTENGKGAELVLGGAAVTFIGHDAGTLAGQGDWVRVAPAGVTNG